MTDHTSYDSHPDFDDLESATCQYTGCDDPATHTVLFYAPREYVAYCHACAWEMLGEAGGKSVREI